MKHLKTATILSLFLLWLTSCSESGPLDEATPEMREVRFNFTREVISQRFEPLTRSESKAKYYGMNVYQDGNPYAYGVFDDETKMSVVLEAGSVYKFECTSLLEDHHEIARLSDDGGVLMYPFCVGTSEKGYPLDKLNSFIYSETDYLSGIYYGKSTVVAGGNVDGDGFAVNYKNELFPSQLRYYGELDKFSLTSDDTIEIDLKAMFFGVKVYATDVPDGSVTWTETYGKVDFCDPVIDAEKLEETTVFSLDDVKNPLYSPTLSMSVEWTRASGNKKTGTVYINGNRNTLVEVALTLGP